jgi:ABC-type transport system involved in multi-copper enzyme maturation permease subunit
MPAPIQYLVHMPERISAVAGVTLTQLVRMRLFFVPAAVALLFLGLQFIPYQANIGVEYQGVAQLQFIKDVSLGCMQLFGLVFCVAATSLLLPRDAEDRILYTILCKPVPRFDYLAGKALGVLALLVLMIGLLDAVMSLLLAQRDSSICAELTAALSANGFTQAEMAPYLEQVYAAGNSWNTQRGVLATLLGYSVLTSLTLLISCVTSGTIVSIIFGLGAYFIGMFQGMLFSAVTAGQGTSSAMRWAEQICAVILPDFGLFSVGDTASSGAELSWALLGWLALVAVAYMLLHLLAATWIFSKKEF